MQILPRALSKANQVTAALRSGLTIPQAAEVLGLEVDEIKLCLCLTDRVRLSSADRALYRSIFKLYARSGLGLEEFTREYGLKPAVMMAALQFAAPCSDDDEVMIIRSTAA